MLNQLPRRAFIKKSAGVAAGLTAFMALPQSSKAGIAEPANYTVQDVIDIILKQIPGAPFEQTVDTLKSGNASQKVTGIITTMFTTIEVIEAAARQNINFIIAHEPTFYNHNDDVNWVSGSDVVKQKQALLKQHGIAVWRFHDYWHSHTPDGILYGVLKKAGWIQYYKQGEEVINIPAMSLKDVALHLKSSLGIGQVRVIGNLRQSCKRIGLIPGAAGGQTQMGFIEEQHPDVLVVGEVHEWETAEYIRDSLKLGKKTSLIVLGHSVSEEPGMEWLAEWLQPKVTGLTVTNFPSGSPFMWV